MKKIFLIQVFALSLTMFTIGCKKEDKEKPDVETSSSTDNAIAEAVFNDVHAIADQAAITGKVISYRMDGSELADRSGSCVDTIIRDTINRKITVDFGTDDCTSPDGRKRKGKILISYTGKYRDPGTVITITFDNYSVNDHKVEGTKIVTNKGQNAAGNLHYTIKVNGTITLASNGGTITWNSDRVREWTEGSDTLTWGDDVYSITGTANGVNAKGVSFDVVITKPLIKKIACRYIVSGTLNVTPAQKPVRTLDYGAGDCDNMATLTINGNVFNITLGQ